MSDWARNFVLPKRKIAIVGPWTGEFGWEIFCWQGWIRQQIREKSFDEVVVLSRCTNAHLYSDFCTFFIPLMLSHETDMWYNRETKRESAKDGLARYWSRIIEMLREYGINEKECEFTYYHPSSLVSYYNERNPMTQAPAWQIPQIFRSYSTRYPSERLHNHRFNVIFHIRQDTKFRTGFRDWSLEHASKLADAISAKYCNVNFYCVGLLPTADCLKQCWDTLKGCNGDYRGKNLQELAVLFSKAHLLIGPQSGPAHFATLCKVPTITWQTKQEHAMRMIKNWNPFRVPNLVLKAPSDDYWKQRKNYTPTVEEIMIDIDQLLSVTVPEERYEWLKNDA